MTKKRKHTIYGLLSFLIAIIPLIVVGTIFYSPQTIQKTPLLQEKKDLYWFVLHRKSNTEDLYRGVPGNTKESKHIKTFTVKAGVPGESPTPLPQLLGRKYWLLVGEESSADNPDTAPYFLRLDIDAPAEWPYGPIPYTECNGEQCDWVLPGYFGLHGTAGDPSKLSAENPGSSGCVRHSDEDITYLYNLLDPANEEIRYYVEDN